jgi:hypothetical protein
MKRAAWALVVAVLACGGAGAAEPSRSAGASGNENQDTWSVIKDDAAFHFQRAKEQLNKDRKVAAQEIRRAAAILEVQAEKATEKTRGALRSSADELNRLAQDVRKGSAKLSQDLDNAFERAKKAINQRL